MKGHSIFQKQLKFPTVGSFIGVPGSNVTSLNAALSYSPTFRFAFQNNPALQPRAMVVFGCINKSTSAREMRHLLVFLAHAVHNAVDQKDCYGSGLHQHSSLLLIESIVIAMTRLQPLLDRVNILIFFSIIFS